MGLENEISDERLREIEIKEISDIIINAYAEAKINTHNPEDATKKEIWQNARANAEKYHYMTYLDKYLKGDKHISKPLREYLVTYLESETAEYVGYKLLEIDSVQRRKMVILYSSFALLVFSTFAPIMNIANFVSLGLYFWHIAKERKIARETESNLCFRELVVEDLREFKEEYFEKAVKLAKENIDKSYTK